MRLLLDTHVLIWAGTGDATRAASQKLAALVCDPDSVLYFSAAAIWEIAVKAAMRRPHFPYDAADLRRSFLANGYLELAIDGQHGIAAAALPPIHKDPFDRIMIAQADIEGLTLVTHDREMLRYPGAMLSV